MYSLQAAFIRGVLLGLVALIVPFSTATGTATLGPPPPTPDTSDAAARSAVDSLDHAPTAFSVNRTLQGALPGVYVTQTNGNPAGGMSVRMRGPNTILGSTSPLYVLDGLPISNASRALIDLGGRAQNRLVDLALHDVERIEVMKGPAAQARYGARASNGVVQIVTKQGTPGAPRVTFSTRVQTEAVRNTLDVNMAQNAQGQFLDNFGNPLPEGKRRWDWQDFIYDRAYGTEQALSVSGGFGDTRYRASGSHLANQGIVAGNSFRRLNGRLRIDQTLNDWAALTGSATYARSTTHDIPNGGLNRAYGALTGVIAGPNTFDPRPNSDGTFPDQGRGLNPLEVIDRFDFTQATNRFIGSAALNMRPTEQLTVDYVLGLDTYEHDAMARVPAGITSPSSAQPGLRNESERNSTHTQRHISSALDIRYRTALSPALQSMTHVGGSLQHETGTTEDNEIQGLPGDPLFSTVANTFETDYDVYSGFVQETLTWKDRLVLTGAGRVAAYPSFNDSGLAFYPSARLAHTLSEQSFWSDTALNRLFPRFTLRAAVGFSGGPASVAPFRSRFTDVTPERTREVEVGADMHLLSDRVAVNATYYRQRTSDLLVNAGLEPAPETSVGFPVFSNAGTLTNRGIELSVQAQIVDRARTNWTSTINFSRNRNEVSDLPEGVNTFPSALDLSSAVNGEALGVFFGTTFRRNAQGNVIDIAGNVLVEDDGVWRLRDPSAPDAAGRGIPVPDAPSVIGDPNPDFVASWINEVGIRNFDLRMQWDAVVGHDVFNYSRFVGTQPISGTSPVYEQELEGTVPMGYTQQAFNIDEHWVEDGSFLKLREVSAAYTVRPAAARIERVRFTLTARNVLSIDGYNGYDPEINVGGQRTGVRGLDLATVPVPRTFSLGLTAVF